MKGCFIDMDGFTPLYEDELFDIDGSSTKVATGVAGVVAGTLGLAALVCGLTDHPGAAAWCAVGAGYAGIAAGVLGAIPLP